MMQFQRLTIVQLRSPEVAPPDSTDDHRIQAEHIAYLGAVRDRGIVALDGPVRCKDAPKFRRMPVQTFGVGEAGAHALADPAVKARWLDAVADGWWLPTNPVTFGGRVDLELRRVAMASDCSR
jgi:hypothetical protein